MLRKSAILLIIVLITSCSHNIKTGKGVTEKDIIGNWYQYKKVNIPPVYHDLVIAQDTFTREEKGIIEFNINGTFTLIDSLCDAIKNTKLRAPMIYTYNGNWKIQDGVLITCCYYPNGQISYYCAEKIMRLTDNLLTTKDSITEGLVKGIKTYKRI